jgi:hypothetical protein
MVETESSSSSSYESEDEIDIVLNEQDAIISNLTQEVKDLNEYSDMLLEELTELQKRVKQNVVRCTRILRHLGERVGDENTKFEVVHVLRILNNLTFKVCQ